ncbi:MAG: TIGR03016 family PEP-CTERM system-associated outer membrane protein [Rhodanobacter sp.]|nr:MAG: TIGR03016 family PEP-CTERM system-associated outer membrane protein [Rhodanobacter sp.]TAL90119.1 MAG: TIGR03016 family PEP-CTERM system-associated outer membrane protein [Rhodanobacter sp.]TAM40901.1 MAG: TIGR03016 family PEP-CTERM system-associated outer membrane protein [Rhodanobacter sp.]TAN25699.1 MAG: TIGR03016 family PEP-CTERM system-associated outer membrane protein [Rhodanobacter sp.]
MRALSASVVLSSIILGSLLTRAEAQNLGLDTLPALNASPGGTTSDSENLPPGVIPQPSIDSPGVVVGVTLGELYTDNLKLAASGTPKQTSWITEVQPFIKSAVSGPRFSGVLDYTLTGYLYEGQASHKQLAQNLSANGTFTILPQHFFIDGGAMYRRELINNELSAGSGAFFLNNNQANVAIGTLSPYWLQDLGRVGSMTLRYTRGRVLYNDRGIPAQSHAQLNGIPDVTSNAVQFQLVSPEGQTWGWNLGYSDQRLDPDFGPGVQFAKATAGVSYQVSNSLHLLADGGKESKFQPDGTVQRLGAPFWDVGFTWSNTRDDFKLMTGHRFFGRSYQLSWTHHAALLTTTLGYVEQPTTYNQQLLGFNSGSVLTRPTGIGASIPSLTERQPYLSKRWAAVAAYTMPKSTLRVMLYEESRTYFTKGSGQERVANADVSWLFNLGAFTTLTPSLDWERYRFRSAQISYRRYAQLALARQLNAKDSVSLQLRRDSGTVHSAVPGAHGYDANVIFLQWTHLF